MKRFAGFLFLLLSVSCASSGKRDTPELSTYQGKKVALVEVKGENTAKRIVEVALVNQLIKRGTFLLLNKQDIETVKVQYDIDPRDWKTIASRAGADIALRANVLTFDGDEREGYNKHKVYDERMAVDRGEDEATTEQVYKVKSLTGTVRVELKFNDLKSGDERTGVAEATDTVKADNRKAAIRLPPVLRYMEKVANRAFHDFFVKYE